MLAVFAVGFVLAFILLLPLVLLGKFIKAFPRGKWLLFPIAAFGGLCWAMSAAGAGGPGIVVAAALLALLLLALPVFACIGLVKLCRRFPQTSGVLLILLVLGAIVWITIAAQVP